MKTLRLIASLGAMLALAALFTWAAFTVIDGIEKAQAKARACPSYQLERAQEQRYTALEREIDREWSAHLERGNLLGKLDPSPAIKKAYQEERVALQQRNMERMAAHRAACIRERDALAKRILSTKATAPKTD